MPNAVIELGRVLLLVLCAVGPVVAWSLLLNARDRRQAALLEAMWVLAPAHLRDVIAIQTHCALLSRSAVVEVDMWGCRREEIWDALVRWSPDLPPGVRLRVNGSIDHGLMGRFRVETVCGPTLGGPQPASR